MDRLERVEQLLAEGWGISFTKYEGVFVASMTHDDYQRTRQAYGESMGEVIENLELLAECNGR